MKIACSACMLGCPCRYDGRDTHIQAMDEIGKAHELIPVCPETFAGLPTPRLPSEIAHNRVINREGEDWTEHFEAGVDKALELVEEAGADLAILQQRSPCCASGKIYDGTFSGNLIEGDGLFAAALKRKGLRVLASDEPDLVQAVKTFEKTSE